MVYLSYFGLLEKFFLIVFNFEYLFLSECYKEVLVYFIYGFGEVGGFVLLIGEVGIGKIILIRSLYE